MLKLSKLKKGDKFHVKHDNKELVITITHIEMEKGIPTVNFKCNGDEDIRISTELKGNVNKHVKSDQIDFIKLKESKQIILLLKFNTN